MSKKQDINSYKYYKKYIYPNEIRTVKQLSDIIFDLIRNNDYECSECPFAGETKDGMLYCKLSMMQTYGGDDPEERYGECVATVGDISSLIKTIKNEK